MTQLSAAVGGDPCRQLPWLDQIAHLPPQWALCAVGRRKVPYHPDNPKGAGWQHSGLDRERFSSLNGQLAAVGLLTGPLSGGVIAIDHDGHSADGKIEELSGLSVEEALPITIGFTSQRDGRYQVLYQVPKDLWDAVTTRKYSTGVKAADSGKEEALEFRWAGAQSVILGAHPDTSGYRWLEGRSPWEVAIAPVPDWIVMAMRDETPPHVFEPRTEWRVERPLETPIPLQNLTTKKHQGYIAQGVSEGMRNDAGAAIARDLIGCEEWARGAGVYFEGNAEALFWQFAQRSGLAPKETNTIWRSALKGNPTPACSTEGLANVVKAWERKNQSKVKPKKNENNVLNTNCIDNLSSINNKKEIKSDSKKMELDDFITLMRDIEVKHGFLTSKYFWELEYLADDLKRSSKFLQGVYNRHLSESCEDASETFAEVCKRAPKEVPWVIPDMLYRGGTTLFHAAGGAGKTLLTYNLIRGLSQTGEFLGRSVREKVRCGLIQVDEPEVPFVERIKELGLQETDNLVKLNWSFGLVSTLDKWIEDNDLGVVIIDSFFAAQKFAETKENDSDHAAILMRLRDIAQRTRAAIIVVHHSNKQGGSRGSGAIPGAVSEVWHLTAPVPDKHSQYKLRADERIFECEKTRMVTPFKMGITLEGETLTWKPLGDLTKIDDGTANEPATAVDRVKLYIAGRSESFTISDLLADRTMLGLERESVKLILSRLKKKGFVDSFPTEGRSETQWNPPRFLEKLKNPDTVDAVNTETHATQDFQSVSSSVSLTVSEPYHQKSDAIHPSVSAKGDTDGDTVDDTDVKPLLSEHPSLTASTVSPKNENFENSFYERQNVAKDTESSRAPLASYTGPKPGDTVKFIADYVSATERAALRKKGIEYPWGQSGTVTGHAPRGTGYAVTVVVGQQSFVVTNLLAIETTRSPKTAEPTDSHGVEGF